MVSSSRGFVEASVDPATSRRASRRRLVVESGARRPEGNPVKFFIPHLKDDPAAAEAEWLRYLEDSSAPKSSRRVRKMTHTHNGERFVVEVGKRRQVFRLKKGPRGGHIKGNPLSEASSATGTEVSGIIDTGSELFLVWSYGPPFDGFVNPAMVGRGSIVPGTIEYFDDEPAPPKPS